MFYLAREVGKIWTCSCWEEGIFIMINEFKYGQTWKIWPSVLSLSLYSTFNNSNRAILNSFKYYMQMKVDSFSVILIWKILFFHCGYQVSQSRFFLWLSVNEKRANCVRSVQILIFSGLFFSIFGLTREIFFLNLRIQTRKNFEFGYFPLSVDNTFRYWK